MSGPLWQPSEARIRRAQLTAFTAAAEVEWGVRLPDYDSLHRWSVREPARFWASVWSFCGVIAAERGERVVEHPERMPGARWFPGARLNFAENLLRRRDDAPALIFRGEDRVRRSVTHRELYTQVARLRQALVARGLRAGDRVAAYLPNLPETLAAMLAATSLGAVWTSCSPDFGARGVIDRFGQVEPRLLFATDGYFYGGAVHDVLERVAAVRREIPSIEQVVIVPYASAEPDLDRVPGSLTWDALIAPHAPQEIDFEPLAFDHPLYVLYSSGTTGAPKCIVHGAGGTLLQHLKEHRLQVDLRRDDRFFYFTTCGWMMWNWLASGLASEATLLLYDGSPFHPDESALFDFAEAEGIDVFGTSARFLDAVAKAGLAPIESHDLARLRTILSTGSPLAPASFDFVYERIKRDLCLSSIAGGTDIVSCFVGGNPTGPVWRGEIQAFGLGMDVAVFDEGGRPVVGQKGELVCRRPFPSMPLGFWNDPDGSRYQRAYFARYPGVWCHGDLVELTEHGGMIMYGRSDAVLNPGGVRIGTAEIYRQVEQLPEVLESLVIGQEWDGDTRIVLFVRLRDGLVLDAELEQRIRRQIREHASPRHVPAVVAQVADIPRTRSGKIVELAVRDVVHGRPVTNQEALANPEALELFRHRPELAR